MNKFENHAGFVITSSKMQVVEIIYKNGNYYLSNINEAYFNEQINFEKDKETKIASLLQGALNELLIKFPLKASAVSFALPFELFHTMQVPYDNTLLHRDLIEEFRWEYSVLFPFLNADDFAIQYIENEKNDLTPYNSALVFAVQRKYILFLQKFCSDNNLKLKFIDNVHLASERAITLSSAPVTKGLILSVYFNKKHLSIIYSREGKPVYFKNIPLNDAGEVPAHLLNETSAKENFKVNKNLIEAAYITGDDISDSIIDSLKNALGIKFFNFNPFDKIKVEPELYENKFYTERFNSFSPAAGIAYRLA